MNATVYSDFNSCFKESMNLKGCDSDYDTNNSSLNFLVWSMVSPQRKLSVYLCLSLLNEWCQLYRNYNLKLHSYIFFFLIFIINYIFSLYPHSSHHNLILQEPLDWWRKMHEKGTSLILNWPSSCVVCFSLLFYSVLLQSIAHFTHSAT